MLKYLALIPLPVLAVIWLGWPAFWFIVTTLAIFMFAWGLVSFLDF